MTRAKKTKQLLELVAEQYKRTPKDLRGIDRHLPIPEARAVFFYLARFHLGLTCSEAGKALNRDYSTATVQGNKIIYKYELYPDVRHNVNSIVERLNPKLQNPYYQMFAKLGGHEE